MNIEIEFHQCAINILYALLNPDTYLTSIRAHYE